MLSFDLEMHWHTNTSLRTAIVQMIYSYYWNTVILMPHNFCLIVFARIARAIQIRQRSNSKRCWILSRIQFFCQLLFYSKAFDHELRCIFRRSLLQKWARWAKSRAQGSHRFTNEAIRPDPWINAQYGCTAMILFHLKAVDLENESAQLSRHINDMHDSHLYGVSCSTIPRGIHIYPGCAYHSVWSR